MTLDLHDQSDARSWITGNATLPQDVERRAEDSGIIRYAARNDDGADFGAVAWVVSDEGELTAGDGGIRVTGAERVLVVVKLFVKEDRQLAWARIEHELADTAMDYDAFLAPHALAHGRLFHRVKLDLGGSPDDHRLSNEELLLEAYQGEAPTALVEKMWAYGRYLLISSSREGGQPCHLLGNWCGEYRGSGLSTWRTKTCR